MPCLQSTVKSKKSKGHSYCSMSALRKRIWKENMMRKLTEFISAFPPFAAWLLILLPLYFIYIYKSVKGTLGKDTTMADEKNIEEFENEDALITLVDDEGNEVEFEFLDVVEYEGEEYIVLIENDEDADEVVILKINPIDDDTEEYVSIDDEDLLQKLFDIFKKKYEGEINFQ